MNKAIESPKKKESGLKKTRQKKINTVIFFLLCMKQPKVFMTLG